MQASGLMTPDVVTVGRDTPLADVVQLMLTHRISGLPVEDGTVVGIVTEGDLRRARAKASDDTGWSFSVSSRLRQ